MTQFRVSRQIVALSVLIAVVIAQLCTSSSYVLLFRSSSSSSSSSSNNDDSTTHRRNAIAIEGIEQILAKMSLEDLEYVRHSPDATITSQQQQKPPPQQQDQDLLRQGGTAMADSSSTGTTFHGEAIRVFGPKRKKVNNKVICTTDKIWLKQNDSDTPTTTTNSSSSSSSLLACTKWSVVMTIFAPSEAVQRAASLSNDWCLVIVADTKTPKDYVQQAGWSSSSSVRSNTTNTTKDDKADYDNNNHQLQQRIHFLSLEQQENWAREMGGHVAAFIDFLPFRHLARKNIGYLYAIRHHAQFVFDFDDENILDPDVMSPMGDFGNETHLEKVRMPITAKVPFNHHPLMEALEITPSSSRIKNQWSSSS
jgi:hypothetical protein